MEQERRNNSNRPVQSTEEDRKLALMLLEQEKEREILARRQPEEQDERIAKMLQELENENLQRLRKEKEELDQKIAEQLWKQEQEAEEERKRKEREKQNLEEWEKTLNLIKAEAKAEADAQLAKLLREKEELAAQIDSLTVEQEKSVSIHLNGIQYPDYWSHQITDYQTFDVPKSSHEFRNILQEFKKGLPQARVQRIERNQNRTIW